MINQTYGETLVSILKKSFIYNLFPVLPEQNTSNGVHYRSGYDAQLFFGDVSNYKNRDPDLR